MFTRCHHCKTTYPVRLQTLVLAGGKMTCSHCDTEFQATESLFSSWPTLTSEPLDEQQVAELLEAENVDAPANADDDHLINTQLAGKTKRSGSGWLILTLVLLLITLLNIAWTFRQDILEHPIVRPHASERGWINTKAPTENKPANTIQLVSRDMQPHPGIEDALVLSATFINRAEEAQPFPVLAVTLFDPNQAPLASRQFQPSEYLAEDADPTQGLAPGAMLPIILELLDPGTNAVGFEIQIL